MKQKIKFYSDYCSGERRHEGTRLNLLKGKRQQSIFIIHKFSIWPIESKFQGTVLLLCQVGKLLPQIANQIRHTLRFLTKFWNFVVLLKSSFREIIFIDQIENYPILSKFSIPSPISLNYYLGNLVFFVHLPSYSIHGT